MNMTVSAYIKSLGCKVNQVEMEEISESLSKVGVNLHQVENDAELVLINTCSVTQMSDKKSRQLIRKATAKNPGALVIVTGCYATNDSEAGKIEGVDIIITNEKKDTIAQIILEAKKIKVSDSIDFNLARSRPYLKIADGCDEYCSYCVIPSLRGSLRSKPVDYVLTRARELADNEAPEIVLTGINIGKYGLDAGSEISLGALIENLHKNVPRLPRIRLSSIEINEIDERILDLIKDAIICRHLHIPLQSGSNKILKAMNRHYDRMHFMEKLTKIKSEITGLCISTDVIAGFPSETEDDFKDTVDVISSAAIDKVHAFKFSSRKGTAASAMKEHIDNQTKSRRVTELNGVGDLQYKNFISSQVGHSLEIVLEDTFGNNGESLRVGLSDNYIKILVSYKGGAKSVKVEPYELAGNYLRAKIIR